MNKTRCILLCLLCIQTISCKTPKIAIIFVVDQFAHHYLDKVKPHLTGGMARLFKHGVEYHNAYVPHAHPTTSTGHAAISTGTYPKTHGIIGNSWLNHKGEKTKYDLNNIDPKYAVFSPTGLYKHAKAPTNLMVDTISDQFILKSKPNKPYKAFALSHKSRAAIALAGKLGKAVWFDNEGRQFTSSKAYFETLPSWIKTFNKDYIVDRAPKNLIWNLFHKNNPFAYNFYHTKNYKFTNYPVSMIGKPLGSLNLSTKGKYGELYAKTPTANQHLLDLAKTCIKHIYKQGDKLLLWISLSPLDPLGHFYGPYSQETLDIIYHLDWQMEQFMRHIEETIKPKHILYGLTADHGVMPIIEILQKEGFKNIYRIDEKTIVEKLNKTIEQTHNVAQAIKIHLAPCFHFEPTVFNPLPKETKTKIIETVKQTLIQEPGIQEAWTFDELKNANFDLSSTNTMYKNQLYKGRSGDIIYKCAPYSAITKYKTGSHHRTPYEYDTHVPLVLYQKKYIQRKQVHQKVLSTQIANTLAKIFKTAKPSASTADPLPGISP